MPARVYETVGRVSSHAKRARTHAHLSYIRAHLGMKMPCQVDRGQCQRAKARFASIEETPPLSGWHSKADEIAVCC